ncbi:MAG TPA: bifunctional DedA family/phosphatase PAP2 family protein [Candidatus Limnocylindria bacterium]|nr:bifunctional DedA family/phosphatase PAP2 family protein [Candidatus Limnocylindria bacterium]
MTAEGGERVEPKRGERLGKEEGEPREAEGRGRRSHLLRLILVALVVGVFVALNRVVPNIDLQAALQDVSSKLGGFTYVLVGLAAFVETAAFLGLLLPGETVVILGGAVAGQGDTSLVLTIGIVWGAALAGDSVSFGLGRTLGRGFILRHGPKLRITPERFARVERYFSRHGGKTIVIGRFIGFVRALAPFTVGSSGMRYRHYLPFGVVGTGLWAATFVLVGYFASQSLDAAARAAGRGTLLFGIVVAVIVAAVVAVRFLRRPENRRRLVAAMERRAALRPLLSVGRIVAPQARFVWGRVTPGELGLEFTTLLAILGVALYVVIAYAVVVTGDPGPAAGDPAAFDLARHLRAAWLTDAAKIVTVLGSAAVNLPLALLATLALAARRRWAEAAVLVAAVAIIYIGVPEIKDATARPRPSHPLATASGWAFPSGHAAHAMIFPWLALTITARLRPGITGGSALLILGIALAALVGLSRVYLRLHYLSDVSGGWALGAAAFAICGAVAMIISHVRQNPAGDARAGEDRH